MMDERRKDQRNDMGFRIIRQNQPHSTYAGFARWLMPETIHHTAEEPPRKPRRARSILRAFEHVSTRAMAAITPAPGPAIVSSCFRLSSHGMGDEDLSGHDARHVK